ncbi:MAG: type II toxin-antitoxin system RelE/ParE family toxin [Desulfobacterales bacterium]|nr:type II toxin-antitoxin system RelE/ParE family toxin [Desulfobacterales bacterium]
MINKDIQFLLRNSLKKRVVFQNLLVLRFGDYRIIYWIQEELKTVWIISVGHRK